MPFQIIIPIRQLKLQILPPQLVLQLLSPPPRRWPLEMLLHKSLFEPLYLSLQGFFLLQMPFLLLLIPPRRRLTRVP